ETCGCVRCAEVEVEAGDEIDAQAEEGSGRVDQVVSGGPLGLVVSGSCGGGGLWAGSERAWSRLCPG
ncbi:MAG: hypothetical protein V3V08_22485, partial [Nannocystaceae bacterium]